MSLHPRHLALALALLLAPALSAGAADFQAGRVAYRSGNYAQALVEWRPLAEAGFADAQYWLGRMHYHGQGVTQDAGKAAEWYRKAAEQGHALAQNNLGRLYRMGEGVAQDDFAALGWYRKAADGGLAVARFNLGRMYDEGRGIPRDPFRAAELYELAATEGYGEAQLRLAQMYETGQGVRLDLGKAEKWYRRAAKQGVSGAQAERERLRAARSEVAEVPESPTTAIPVPDETAEEQQTPETPSAPTLEKVAPDELLAPAESGDREAQYLLGLAYATGQGVRRDGAKAEEWFVRAARNDHALAWYRLAFLHLRGTGGSAERDYVQALFWMKLAASRDVGDARSWCDRIIRRMSDDEIARADELVKAWQGRESP